MTAIGIRHAFSAWSTNCRRLRWSRSLCSLWLNHFNPHLFFLCWRAKILQTHLTSLSQSGEGIAVPVTGFLCKSRIILALNPFSLEISAGFLDRRPLSSYQRAPSMNLQELKRKTPAELLAFAEELEI